MSNSWIYASAPAGRAPGCPEVDDDHLSAQFTQRDSPAVETGDREVGCHPTVARSCLCFFQTPSQQAEESEKDGKCGSGSNVPAAGGW